jgi:hypothetical protein
MVKRAYSCGGPMSFSGSCGALDCPRCRGASAVDYETDPGADDADDEQDDRTEEREEDE